MVEHKNIISLAALVLYVVSGPALARPTPGNPSSRPEACSGLETQFEEPAGVLTLEDAIGLSLARNPELKASCWRVASAEAAALQEGLVPNPELEFEIEEFGGTGQFEDGDSRETTVLISQQIELGGKRKRRKDTAVKEIQIAGWDYGVVRHDILARVKTAFYEVLLAREGLELAEERATIAQQVHKTVSARVRAGKVSPVEEIKSANILSRAGIELSAAKGNLETARKNLSLLWGSSKPRFTRAAGDLYSVSPPPSLEKLMERIDQSPELSRWSAEMESRQAGLRLAKSLAVPDISLGFGIKSFAETDDTAYVAQASVSLPLFDRNQGGTRQARYLMAETEEAGRSARSQARGRLLDAHREMSLAFERAETLREQVLPGAEKVFEAVSIGYRARKFGYLELLDAQERLAEANAEYLEALSSYHRSKAELERLIGSDLESIIAKADQPDTGEKK